MVNGLYVNPGTSHNWVVDRRVFGYDSDGKNKFIHVHEIQVATIASERLIFTRVFFDSWQPTKDLMLLAKPLNKRCCYALKNNRQVDDSVAERPYRLVDELHWRQSDWSSLIANSSSSQAWKSGNAKESEFREII